MKRMKCRELTIAVIISWSIVERMKCSGLLVWSLEDRMKCRELAVAVSSDWPEVGKYISVPVYVDSVPASTRSTLSLWASV